MTKKIPKRIKYSDELDNSELAVKFRSVANKIIDFCSVNKTQLFGVRLTKTNDGTLVGNFLAFMYLILNNIRYEDVFIDQKILFDDEDSEEDYEEDLEDYCINKIPSIKTECKRHHLLEGLKLLSLELGFKKNHGGLYHWARQNKEIWGNHYFHNSLMTPSFYLAFGIDEHRKDKISLIAAAEHFMKIADRLDKIPSPLTLVKRTLKDLLQQEKVQTKIIDLLTPTQRSVILSEFDEKSEKLKMQCVEKIDKFVEMVSIGERLTFDLQIEKFYEEAVYNCLCNYYARNDHVFIDITDKCVVVKINKCEKSD